MSKVFLKSNMAVFISTAVLYLWYGDVLAARERDFEALAIKLESPQPPEEVFSRPQVEYTSGTLRDPFQGVNTKTSASKQNVVAKPPTPLPPMDVQGIVWGGNFNQAIINNKVVKAGDTIEGAKIINIEKNKIILLYDGTKHVLSTTGTGAQPPKAVTKN